ncbi:MAG TPA: LysR substrate-binding domain-containing protein [Alphaproteobacteria bacterium]|jgi:DNA-binding transcriptional LysR family regulator|nr:LysR substrate-binding domain-containing protein [Alphaproteobacteria bacterium]
MDAADLRVFEAVARLGSMSRAAAELNTVQSNVTARIRQLEDELGAALFHRSSRGVVLTDAGRRLLPYAAEAGRVLADARRAVADQGTPSGPLVIGSLETTAALRLSPILADYVARYPEVDLALRTGTTEEMVAEVLAHRLDGAFVCGPVAHPELEEQAIFREELALLTAPGARGLEALLAGQATKIVVLRLGCSYRQRLEDILARRGIVGLRRLEFGTIEAIIACVAAGLGVTLLPRSLIGTVWRDGRVAVHPLPESEARVDTVFVRRRDGFASSALAAFLDRARSAPLSAAAE